MAGGSWQAWHGGERWWSEEGRGGESWSGWHASGGEASAGGGERAPRQPQRRGGTPAVGGRAPRPREDVPEEEVIYSTWPLSKQDYPETGEHSFRALSDMAQDLDCRVTTRDRRVRGRPARPRTLTIKGPQCYAVYQAFLDAAMELKADLSKVKTTKTTKR